MPTPPPQKTTICVEIIEAPPNSQARPQAMHNQNWEIVLQHLQEVELDNFKPEGLPANCNEIIFMGCWKVDEAWPRNFFSQWVN